MKMKLFLTLSLLFFIFFTKGQNSINDSLEKIIALNKNDIDEARALNNLANEYLRTDLPKAKTLLYEAIRLGNQLEHSRTLSAAFSQLVTIFQNTGKMDSAIIYLNKLKILAETDQSSNKAIVKGNYLSTAGLYYKRAGSFNEALPYFKESLSYMEKADNKLAAAGQALNVGNIYFHLANYKQALQYYLKSLRWFEETGNTKGVAFCYQNISENYVELKQYKEALKYVNKAIILKISIGDTKGLGNAEHTLGRIYLGLKKYDKALLHFNNAKQIAKKMKLTSDEGKINFNIGKLFVEKKDLKAANYHFTQSKLLAEQQKDSAAYLAADLEISSLQKNTLEVGEFEAKAIKTLNVFQQKGDLLQKATSIKHLSDFYYSKKDFEKALEYSNKYHQLNDSIRSNEIQGKFKEIEEQYNSEKNGKQIALLQKDQQINEQRIKQQQYFIWNAVVLALLVLVGIGLLINRYRLKQRMKEIELRNRIAADLHDEVGSSLSSIHMLSQMARQQNFKNQEDILKKVSTNAFETMEKMNDIVWVIKPTENDGLVLRERMQRFMYDLCSSKNIKCNITADELDEMKLTMLQKKNLYLIFKEAINNSVKYSETPALDVKIFLQQKQLLMQIKDYGKGFDESIIIKGNGLENMQVRAKELKGSLQFSSLLKTGTELNLNFPV